MIEATIESAPRTSGNVVAPGNCRRGRGCPSSIAAIVVTHVGLEQVGGHAGAIADVVADVVGDDGRVARIVFGNAGFDLTDEVGADVGGLRVDTAAETREDRDQRTAEREADQRVERLGVVAGVDGEHDPVVAADREQIPGRRRAAR